jgi:hypothetical protein
VPGLLVAFPWKKQTFFPHFLLMKNENPVMQNRRNLILYSIFTPLYLLASIGIT